ncbi:MAG TPA: hypothetical protein VFJ91_05370 [Gaiellaceae bacterium]|nr:hypothetical protein [Gaiellaceae bacterium]
MAHAAEPSGLSDPTPQAGVAGALSHPPLRLTRLRNGYRIGDVEFVLAQLQQVLREREAEAAALRREVDELRAEAARLRTQQEVVQRREREVLDAEADARRRVGEIEEQALERARRIVGGAELDAQRIRGDARLRIDETAAEYDELLRLKEGLLRSLRALVREFQESVERVARGEPLAMPAPRAAFEESAEPEPPSGEVVADEVEVIAGPFHDFASLSRFEQAVGRLPHVSDVYVRHFASDRAVIEVSLAEPAPLEDELRRLMPYPLEVSHGAGGALVVDIEPRGSAAERAR